MEKELRSDELVRIINELRARNWSDTEILEFLLVIETSESECEAVKKPPNGSMEGRRKGTRGKQPA